MYQLAVLNANIANCDWIPVAKATGKGPPQRPDPSRFTFLDFAPELTGSVYDSAVEWTEQDARKARAGQMLALAFARNPSLNIEIGTITEEKSDGTGT